MKNLVVIHLESLNSAFLYQNSDVFPNIMKLKEKSMFFSNYYSTATSTIMTMTDLMYEDSKCSEKSTDLMHFEIASQSNAWIEELGMDFKEKQVYIYPFLDWKYDWMNIRKIMGKTAKVEQKKKYQAFQDSISEGIQNLNGGFMYIFDWSSVYMKGDCERKYNSWKEFYFMQYAQIDKTLGFVYEQLEKYDKLDETLILAFGDHGDDMYTYGKNKGFTHAIAPYPNIIKTPLMIYQHGKSAGINKELICTFDVGKILKNICAEKQMDIHREYVFSRNLFPLQKSPVLEKSYSVTDGEYLLLVSSKGLEMYICQFMSQSNFNLLNWFLLKRDGNIEIQQNESMHFKRMIYDQKEEIETSFYKLRKALYSEMKQMVNRGLLEDNIKWWFTKIYYNSKE